MDETLVPRNINIAWLEDLPPNWMRLCAKYIFRILNGSTPKSSESSYWDGEINWVTPSDLGSLEGDTIFETARKLTRIGYENSGTTLVPPGSLILSTRAPIGHTAIAGVELCTNQGCRTLAFKTHDDTRYFFYQLLAAKPMLQALGRGTTFLELTSSDLSDFQLLQPPLTEQNNIAGFLDRETAVIDTLITKKQELIWRLHEKRTALISHAVTKGLDPAAPMKDSGTEWLGVIPAHWQTIRSKWLFALRKTKAYPTDQQITVSQKHGPIYQEDFVDLEGRRVMEVIKGADILQHIEPGDFVISMRSFQGGIEFSKIRGSVSSAYVVLIPAESVHTDFFAHLLKSSQYIQALQGTTNLIRDGQAIRYSNFVLVDLPVVPIDEQKQIASYLNRETKQIDVLVQKLEKIIGHLKEYRTALISAAIIGKVDVRDHGPEGV